MGGEEENFAVVSNKASLLCRYPPSFYGVLEVEAWKSMMGEDVITTNVLALVAPPTVGALFKELFSLSDAG